LIFAELRLLFILDLRLCCGFDPGCHWESGQRVLPTSRKDWTVKKLIAMLLVAGLLGSVGLGCGGDTGTKDKKDKDKGGEKKDKDKAPPKDG